MYTMTADCKTELEIVKESGTSLFDNYCLVLLAMSDVKIKS